MRTWKHLTTDFCKFWSRINIIAIMTVPYTFSHTQQMPKCVDADSSCCLLNGFKSGPSPFVMCYCRKLQICWSQIYHSLKTLEKIDNFWTSYKKANMVCYWKYWRQDRWWKRKSKLYYICKIVSCKHARALGHRLTLSWR